jgi:hypothetical protein
MHEQKRACAKWKETISIDQRELKKAKMEPAMDQMKCKYAFAFVLSLAHS